jgi:hypothetical protein
MCVANVHLSFFFQRLHRVSSRASHAMLQTLAALHCILIMAVVPFPAATQAARNFVSAPLHVFGVNMHLGMQ